MTSVRNAALANRSRDLRALGIEDRNITNARRKLEAERAAKSTRRFGELG